MKNIDIYVNGSYNNRTSEGTWVYYLSYKKAVIKRTGYIVIKRTGYIVNTTSYAKATLQGLYMALQHITEPCIITIHSKYPLGFKNPKKSPNKSLLNSIQSTINKAGHIIEFDCNNDFKVVEQWETLYGNKNKDVKPKAKEPVINIDVNDVFKDATLMNKGINDSTNWRDMYDDIINSNDGWVPRSGGY